MNKNDLFQKIYLESFLAKECPNNTQSSQDQNQQKPEGDSPIDDLEKENTVTIAEEGGEGAEEGGDENQNTELNNNQNEDDSNLADGWDEEMVENLSPLLDDIESFIYELKNCVRGSFTGCKTKKQLKEYMNGLAKQLNEYAEDL